MSNISSSIAASSEASRHSGATATTVIVTGSGGSKTAKPPSLTSQFNILWVESRTIQVIRARNCNLSLTMTAHPRVIVRFPICNLLHTSTEGRRTLGDQPSSSQATRAWEKNRCVLTTRGNGKHHWACQTYHITAKGARRVGPTGTLEASRGHGEVHVDFRRLTKTFRRIQHVTHVAKPNIGGFDWVKGQGPSRITQLPPRNTTRKPKPPHVAEGVCNMLMSSSVSLRIATPLSKDQPILRKLMITAPSGP